MCCKMKYGVDGVDKWVKPHDIIRIGGYDYRWDGFTQTEHMPSKQITIEIPATGYVENTPVGYKERCVPVGHVLLGALSENGGSFKLVTTGRISNLNDVVWSKGQLGRKPLAVKKAEIPENPGMEY